MPFEKFAEKAFGGFFVPSALHEDVEYIAILVHSSPQILSLATDRKKDFVHMPCVATMRATTTEFIGIRLPERANTIVARFHNSRSPLFVPEVLPHREN
jgi:hypothetical protein